MAKGEFFFLYKNNNGGYLTVGVPFYVLVNSLNGKWCYILPFTPFFILFSTDTAPMS